MMSVANRQGGSQGKRDVRIVPCDPGRENVWAVVVTLNPDAALGGALARLKGQVAGTVVVDNGSEQEALALLKKQAGRSMLLECNAHNVGLATALNQGLRRAIGLGAAWALTLDQDSDPAADLIDQMALAYRRAAAREQLCIVAPRVVNFGLGSETLYLTKALGPFYRRRRCVDGDLTDVTSVITSGALVNLSVFAALGGFREDLFIDYVDTEFCLRALSRGYRIAVACEAGLEHRLGRRTRESLGPLTFYPTHHSPVRWYYMSRNRIPMIRSYGMRFPHWLSYEIVASLYVLVRMLLTEGQRRAKLAAALRGTWDGLRGRMGPGPLGAT